MATQIDGFLAGNAGKIAEMADDGVESLKDTLGGMFGNKD